MQAQSGKGKDALVFSRSLRRNLGRQQESSFPGWEASSQDRNNPGC